VPDPGPQTGAWDPFALDDEGDEPGAAGAGGGQDPRGHGAPRPTLRDDAAAVDADRRPRPRPLAALRRTSPPRAEEPPTDAVDVGRRRSGFGSGWRPQRAAGAVAGLGAPAFPRIRTDEPTALTNGKDLHDPGDVRGDVAGPQREASEVERDDLSDGDLRVDPRGAPAAPDDDPDGLPAGDTDHADDLDDPLDDPFDDEPRPAQAWAGVVAQWLAGAVAGAVLWVLFRYLWRGLPVVALAAALLVTAGLVLAVRQLLHDVDRRTTAFAVLVGLLLTASPAVLVLLGR
jgi:hypothetical protein